MGLGGLGFGLALQSLVQWGFCYVGRRGIRLMMHSGSEVVYCTITHVLPSNPKFQSFEDSAIISTGSLFFII